MNFPLQKIIIIAFLAAYTSGFSQRFMPPEIINGSKGLTSDLILSTANNPSHFLYLATKKSLFKYDGYRFVNLLEDNSIWSQLYEKKGFLYFHDTNGLKKYNTANDSISLILQNDFTDSDPNNDHFNNIFIDSKGRIWATDFNYVKYFLPKEKKTKTFLMDSESKSLHNYTIFEPFDDEIWAVSKYGLWVWEGKTGKMKPHPNPEIDNLNYTAAIQRYKNEIWLATEDGKILAFYPASKKIKIMESLPKGEVVTGFSASEKELLLYSSKRIYELKNGTYNLLYFSEKRNINHVNLDATTGIVWVSTDKGLVKLPPIKPGIEVQFFPKKDSLDNNVVSIVETENKVLWALTDAGEVWKNNNADWQQVYKNETLKTFTLNKANNKIILSTNAGLWVWNESTFTKTPVETIDEAEIKKVLAISQKEIWILFSDKIQRYSWPELQLLENRFTNESIFWEDNQWNDIAVDTENRVWLAGWTPKGYGIHLYDPVRYYFEDISAKKMNPDKSVFVGDYFNRIGFANGTNLLFSAYGGWNKVDESGKVIKKIDVHGYDIEDVHIEGISEDENGNVFFATGDGLHVYRNDIDKVVQLLKADGIPTQNLLYAYTVLSDGKIALGIPNGIAIIDPKAVLQTQLKNRLTLTQIKKNGTRINATETDIELAKDQTDLTLYFSNLSFLDASKTTYQYKFDDEKQWHDLGNNPELSLNHIAPGSYTIEIRTEDNLKNTQQESLKISMVAHPPFFKSKLFYGLLMLLIISIVILIQRYLSKRKQKEANYLQKIKETEMQTLRAQMNPHFMFNTLNSINSYIIQNKTEDASEYLTTFSKLMRNILQNSKEQSISLQNELQTLKLYMQLESARLEHSFDYTVKVSENIDETEISVPPLIVQPYVENAIWHGLRNKKEKGELLISVYKNGTDDLKITVQDNGVGREKSALLKKNQVSHKSYGMEITHDRLKMLNVENSVEIEDLYDTEKNALGTKVILTLKILEND